MNTCKVCHDTCQFCGMPMIEIVNMDVNVHVMENDKLLNDLLKLIKEQILKYGWETTVD